MNIESKNSLKHQRKDHRPFTDLHPFQLPRVGGSDLSPFVSGGGGMLMDPSGFGIPTRFNRGDPSGSPVPPGARFDPFGPPIIPSNRFNPDQPPDFDDFLKDPNSGKTPDSNS